MGRKLAVTLAIALLMFALAPMVASADTVTTSVGTLTIPDGSTVTSILYFPTGGVMVDFSVPDGSGDIEQLPTVGTFGQINFTIPVTNLNLVGFLGPGGLGEVELFASSPTFSFSLDCSDTSSVCPGPFDVTLSGPVSRVGFGSLGPAGIESMSYTVGVPEPSTILLLSLGLIAITMIKERSSRLT